MSLPILIPKYHIVYSLNIFSADGWKSLTKDAVNGVCVNVDYKVSS